MSIAALQARPPPPGMPPRRRGTSPRTSTPPTEREPVPWKAFPSRPFRSHREKIQIRYREPGKPGRCYPGGVTRGQGTQEPAAEAGETATAHPSTLVPLVLPMSVKVTRPPEFSNLPWVVDTSSSFDRLTPFCFTCQRRAPPWAPTQAQRGRPTRPRPQTNTNTKGDDKITHPTRAQAGVSSGWPFTGGGDGGGGEGFTRDPGHLEET